MWLVPAWEPYQSQGPQGLTFEEEFAAYQLVGEVTAHQG